MSFCSVREGRFLEDSGQSQAKEKSVCGKEGTRMSRIASWLIY